MRKDKANYYLDIADAVRSRSPPPRRPAGAILGANDEIISTGYNGAPRGRKNCDELGRCTRQELQIPSGQRYELCRAVHAEENAIISAARKEMLGSTLFLVGRDAQSGELLSSATPCTLCRRTIINAGIKNVICRISETEFTDTPVSDWIENDDTLQ